MDTTYWNNKNVLVTGCDGFLGKALLCKLVNIFDSNAKAGESHLHHIHAIDNGVTSSAQDRIQRSYIIYHSENALNFAYESIPTPDIVIHLAGLASPAQYKRFPLETIDVAVTLTRKLLECCMRWRSKFVFFSSSEIYGNPSPEFVPTNEDYRGYVSSQGPRACYDESKRLGETLCYVYNTYHAVPTNIIRPFNIYGPGMSKFDYRMIPNLLKSAINNQPICVYGDGSQTRTFCYLDDAIDGIVRVCSHGLAGHTYNLGAEGPEVTMTELVNIFNEATGLTCTLEYTDYPSTYPGDEPLRRCPSIQKAKEHLSYNPKISLSDGLRYTYDWALRNYK